MEAPYKQGDIIEVNVKLGLKLRPDHNTNSDKTQCPTQTKGETLEVLSNEVSGDEGYIWMKVRANEGEGWLAVGKGSEMYTKLKKSAQVVKAQDAKYHAEEIKKHADAIITLSK